MAKSYQFTEQAARKTAAMVRRLLGTPRRGPGIPPTAFLGQDLLFRTGLCYTHVSPLAGGTPGQGEVLFDQLDQATPAFVNADDLPTAVFNYSTTTFLAGSRVVCFLDTTALRSADPAGGYKAAWVIADYVGAGGGGDQAYVKAGMDSTTANTNNAWTTAGTKTINWKRGREIETNTAILECEDDDPFTYIHVKQAGYYRVHSNLTVYKTTTDSDAAGVHDVQYGITQILEATAPAVLQDSSADLRFINVKNEGFLMIAATVETAGHFDADDQIKLQAVLTYVSSRGIEAVANHSTLCVQLITLD